MSLLQQAVLLGIVQGLTEFIPISSSAHLIILPWLFGWQDRVVASLPFDVALHLGTLVAVLAFFAADWERLVRAWIASLTERRIGHDPDRRLAWLLIIGCIPAGIVGVLAEAKIDSLFHKPDAPHLTGAMIAIAILTALLGALLLLAERLARHERKMNRVLLKDALWIGLAQAMAVFPGVSRSGGTITAGLAVGLERETAARFSFLLSAPIIAVAGVRSLWNVVHDLQAGLIAQADFILFPIGFVVAAISGYLCIRFLLRYLQKNSTDIFVYYRWALAVLIVVVALARR